MRYWSSFITTCLQLPGMLFLLYQSGWPVGTLLQNLDDEIFARRHQKPETEEKRRKRSVWAATLKLGQRIWLFLCFQVGHAALERGAHEGETAGSHWWRAVQWRWLFSLFYTFTGERSVDHRTSQSCLSRFLLLHSLWFCSIVHRSPGHCSCHSIRLTSSQVTSAVSSFLSH